MVKRTYTSGDPDSRGKYKAKSVNVKIDYDEEGKLYYHCQKCGLTFPTFELYKSHAKKCKY